MGRKDDPILRKAINMGQAAKAGDEETVEAEADELPKDENGQYKI